MEVIRVADVRERVFPHPTEVLETCAPEGQNLHWAILDLPEAFAPEGSDLDVLAIQQRVEQSPQGLRQSYDDLLGFVSGLQQVIDGLFVAAKEPDQLPARTATDAGVLESADIVLAAIDSSFWIVAAPSSIIRRFDGRFADVHPQDPEQVSLSTWGR